MKQPWDGSLSEEELACLPPDVVRAIRIARDEQQHDERVLRSEQRLPPPRRRP